MNTARCRAASFLDVLGIKAGTKDGRFAVDFWADNVGFDNQRYHLELYEPGRQYFNIGWDQTPHLLSSSAKTLFGGVGIDPPDRRYRDANLFAEPVRSCCNPTPAQRANIDQFIGGAPPFGGAGFPAPMYNIELKTLREKFTAGYRNTMLDDWDFNVDYSHEHRTGTRPLGIGWGVGTSAQSAAVHRFDRSAAAARRSHPERKCVRRICRHHSVGHPVEHGAEIFRLIL